MDSPRNVTLIGMPGSGKTTVGRILSQRWGWRFLDTDRLIEEREGKRLEEIIELVGREAFLGIEAGHVKSLLMEKTIIATGGSVVYDHTAMAHLESISSIVYLDVPLTELERRLGSLKARGVVIAPGMSVADLWRERDPLYRRYAGLTVLCRGDDSEQSALEVEELLRGQESSFRKS